MARTRSDEDESEAVYNLVTVPVGDEAGGREERR
jgi:hypothetical protein